MTRGVGREKIFIKLAFTREGIRAAEILQVQGIDGNLALLLSLAQAAACADAGVALISTFVGRITDWYAAKEGRKFEAKEDLGVASVREIYDYYKSNGIETVVMGASFRNIGQVKALAGCNRLTISPNLLEKLHSQETELQRILSPENSSGMDRVSLDESDFRWSLNANAMAPKKLSEGIRNFDADQQKLLQGIEEKLGASAAA